MPRRIRARLFGLTCAAVAAIVPAAGAATTSPDRVYTGKTSQQEPIGFKISRGKVTVFYIQFTTRCQSGKPDSGYYGWLNPPPVVPVHANGSFSERDLSKGTTRDGKRRFRLKSRLKGHVSGRAATGTYTGVFRMYTLKGKFLETCTAGTLMWSAAQSG